MDEFLSKGGLTRRDGIKQRKIKAIPETPRTKEIDSLTPA